MVISNPILRKYFNKTIERIHISNGNIFGTVASIAAYTEGKEWRNKFLEYINRNVALTEEYFRNNIPEIIPVHPEATYMIWLDCRKLGMTGSELQDFFINKAGVGLNEGSTFGPGGEGFMRMNLATTSSLVLKALDRIACIMASGNYLIMLEMKETIPARLGSRTVRFSRVNCLAPHLPGW